jgi:hypothetical protein
LADFELVEYFKVSQFWAEYDNLLGRDGKLNVNSVDPIPETEKDPLQVLLINLIDDECMTLSSLLIGYPSLIRL